MEAMSGGASSRLWITTYPIIRNFPSQLTFYKTQTEPSHSHSHSTQCEARAETKIKRERSYIKTFKTFNHRHKSSVPNGSLQRPPAAPVVSAWPPEPASACPRRGRPPPVHGPRLPGLGGRGLGAAARDLAGHRGGADGGAEGDAGPRAAVRHERDVPAHGRLGPGRHVRDA